MCVRFIFLFVEIEISDRREVWRIAMKTFAIVIAREMEMGDVAEEAGAQDTFLRGHWHTVGEQRVRYSLA